MNQTHKHREKNRLSLKALTPSGGGGMLAVRTDERISSVITQILSSGDYRSKTELIYDAVFSLARSKGIHQGVPGPVPTEDREDLRLANYAALLRATIG